MSRVKPKSMMIAHMPDDPALLAAVGRVALRHAHLDNALRMTIKSLTNVSVEEALDATEFEGSGALREHVLKLARKRLGDGAALVKLQALLARTKRATEDRNDLIHSLWGQPLDGKPVKRTRDHRWKQLPTVDELNALQKDIEAITNELNRERLHGWLAEALANSRRPNGKE
jgi:hypothetical protein